MREGGAGVGGERNVFCIDRHRSREEEGEGREVILGQESQLSHHASVQVYICA